MEEKDQKKQIIKISVFITSIFVIFLSVTYAFINQTLTGTKRQVITAGNLSLELQEDENNLTITDAMPMYDEVGMIQEAFTFRLVNKIDVRTNYIVKLEKIIVADPLDESLVKYGLTKDEEVTIDFVSNIEEGVIDTGVIEGNQTINYSLRLWIDSSVEDESLISSKSLSYKLNIEATQNTDAVQLPPATNTSELVSDKTDLGESCKTYNDGVDTFLVGQCQNNYVWYSGKLWRVVLKNNETGSVKMITDNAMTVIEHSSCTKDSVGGGEWMFHCLYNNSNFENSYVDQWLTQEFLPTLHDPNKYLIENAEWNASPDNNASSAPIRPVGTTKINRTVGLLNAYEYYTTYNNSDGLATKENGYLNNEGNWWLLTPYYREDYQVAHIVSYKGIIKSFYSNNVEFGNGVRPTVNFKSDIKIISGLGTQDNPYRLEGDSKEFNNGSTLINSRYSGEYITFNNELYRIVGIENGLTKIISVAKARKISSSYFHGKHEVVTFANADIKMDLEDYYQSLQSTYKNLIEPNTTWYFGEFDAGASYKSTICATASNSISVANCSKTSSRVTSNIGLPRIGEMFSSVIVRESRPWSSFWTIISFKDLRNSIRMEAYYVSSDSLGLSYDSESIRPSMYLKSTVKIASSNTGDGTYDNPYDIEL